MMRYAEECEEFARVIFTNQSNDEVRVLFEGHTFDIVAQRAGIEVCLCIASPRNVVSDCDVLAHFVFHDHLLGHSHFVGDEDFELRHDVRLVLFIVSNQTWLDLDWNLGDELWLHLCQLFLHEDEQTQRVYPLLQLRDLMIFVQGCAFERGCCPFFNLFCCDDINWLSCFGCSQHLFIFYLVLEMLDCFDLARYLSLIQFKLLVRFIER